MKFIRSFLQFLWDFFVGDTPELFVGACVIVVTAWFTHQFAGSVAIYTLPASVTVVLGWSLYRSRRR
jgi:CRISPR/Cas system endoribonuclease Cas6 (RAMP superfamily)